jgi:DNA modification methylase
MQWLVRMITPPNGCVLDPFAGTGTTAVAAVREGFQVILCENDPESQNDIRHRFPKV